MYCPVITIADLNIQDVETIFINIKSQQVGVVRARLSVELANHSQFANLRRGRNSCISRLLILKRSNFIEKRNPSFLQVLKKMIRG